MIVEAFLRWAETAKTAERARAASALARAYIYSPMNGEQHRAADMALTWLLDDPSPKVRLALAAAMARADCAPRGIILSLAEDQPEIAGTVIASSPVLCESDLVDLAGRGDEIIRGFIAARTGLTAGVAAAIVEVGGAAEAAILLENASAAIARATLRRLAERFGDDVAVRNLLLDRADLPADARHLLVNRVSAALAACGLVSGLVAPMRLQILAREAENAATVTIASNVSLQEIPALVSHLRQAGRLTPAMLLQALCCGRIDFFAEAVVQLSSLDAPRARAILATGRAHAVRALFKASGLDDELAEVFLQAVMLWRKASASADALNISGQLLSLFRNGAEEFSQTSAVIEMIERVHRAGMRHQARSFASDAWLAA